MGWSLADVIQELRRHDFNTVTNIVGIKKNDNGIIVKIETEKVNDGQVKSRAIKSISEEQ